MTESNREPLLKLLREVEGGSIVSQQAVDRLREVVYGYLRGLVVAEGNLVGPKALREANWLYGYAESCKGLVETIAEAFGVSRPRLSWMLARERQIRCAECGREFTVREPRKKGGYTESQETICKACKRRGREESLGPWREERAAARRRERQVEEDILGNLAAGQSPLQSEAFRRHLITYALHWSLGRPSQYTFNVKVCVGPGCMICGQEPVGLFVFTVERSRQIPQEAAIVQRMSYLAGAGEDEDEEDSGRLPLLSLYQALARMSPRIYFGGVPYFPVRDLPVLLLCAECGAEFADSHDELEVGEIQVREQQGRITQAQAGDVVYEIDEFVDWWW